MCLAALCRVAGCAAPCGPHLMHEASRAPPRNDHRRLLKTSISPACAPLSKRVLPGIVLWTTRHAYALAGEHWS